jgi:hypothetical protein
MDSQRIRLSALGRDVKVGNLYNYHSDAISICKFSYKYIKSYFLSRSVQQILFPVLVFIYCLTYRIRNYYPSYGILIKYGVLYKVVSDRV